jgi:AcrR family transcriptional regulator
MDDTAEWSARRADARRNHERVLEAAIEVFTEHGLDATIPQVAARAGVGKATVYRSYPSKTDLVAAVAQVHIDWLTDRITHAAQVAQTDADQALRTLLHEITARLAQDRLMVEALSGVEGIEDALASGDLDRILALGREQGSLRHDVTLIDLQILVGGFARALIELEIREAEVWQRYATLTLAALRP